MVNIIKEEKIMDKKSARLRIPKEDDNYRKLQIWVDKELFIQFKTLCISEGITMKDKMTGLITSSLS